jgi:long-subunit acyl-CoA synthetase (AMP-forming)
MGLIRRIKAINSFQIIDEVSGKGYKFKDLPEVIWANEGQGLIFCYLDNSFESISFLMKAFESKHVLVLLSITLSDNFKEILERKYSPNYIFDSSRSEIVTYTRIGSVLHHKLLGKEHDLHPELKVLLSTSGTTGSPKLVKLSEENLLSNAEAIAAYLPISSTDIVPLNLPVHYSYGLSVLTSNAISGATVCAGSLDVMSKGFWENFQKYQYSTLAGVPFVYEMLDRIGFTKMDLPSLRYFTQAGGKLRDDLVKKYGVYATEKGKLFYVMYGQTEATARMSYLEPSALLTHIGSIGKAISGGMFNINPETSELLFKGPNVFGGYAEKLEDLRSFESPGVLNTGDLARFDDEGFIFITGRSKRIAKIFGNRINLDELESSISKHFSEYFACIGWQDKTIVIFSTNDHSHPKDVIDWVSTEYKLHPSSFKFMSIQSFPLTANGKIDYSILTLAYDS